MNASKQNRTQGISRRGFHRRLASTVGSLAAVGLAVRPGARTAHAAEAPGGGYVDVHVHLTQPWSKREALTAADLLGWMDEHNVDRAVVLPLISPEAWYYAISNDWVLEQTKPHRDRLIPFCDVDPRTLYLKSVKDIIDVLSRYIDAGAKGFGEHKCGGPINSPGNLNVFRAAGELGLPVLFHMDKLRNTDTPGLPGLEQVLKEAPGANFIGHAPGWWASISGDCTAADMAGYPKTAVTPGGAIDRLMEEYPNIYGEFSAGSGANSILRDPEFGREFIIRRADRLLFGTDYLMPGQEIKQFDLFADLDLPADVEAKLYRDNSAGLLGSR